MSPRIDSRFSERTWRPRAGPRPANGVRRLSPRAEGSERSGAGSEPPPRPRACLGRSSGGWRVPASSRAGMQTIPRGRPPHPPVRRAEAEARIHQSKDPRREASATRGLGPCPAAKLQRSAAASRVLAHEKWRGSPVRDDAPAPVGCTEGSRVNAAAQRHRESAPQLASRRSRRSAPLQSPRRSQARGQRDGRRATS